MSAHDDGWAAPRSGQATTTARRNQSSPSAPRLPDVTSAERSPTYFHVSDADASLGALVEHAVTGLVRHCQDATSGKTGRAALQRLIDEMSQLPQGRPPFDGQTLLTQHHSRLALSSPDHYARVVAPLRNLVEDILCRGMSEGAFHADLDIPPTAVVISQILLGGQRRRRVSDDLDAKVIDTKQLFSLLTGSGSTTRPRGARRE